MPKGSHCSPNFRWVHWPIVLLAIIRFPRPGVLRLYPCPKTILHSTWGIGKKRLNNFLYRRSHEKGMLWRGGFFHIPKVISVIWKTIGKILLRKRSSLSVNKPFLHTCTNEKFCIPFYHRLKFYFNKI